MIPTNKNILAAIIFHWIVKGSFILLLFFKLLLFFMFVVSLPCLLRNWIIYYLDLFYKSIYLANYTYIFILQFLKLSEQFDLPDLVRDHDLVLL